MMRAMSLKVVAERLGISYSTVYALVTRGQLKGFRAGVIGAAGVWRVDETDLEAFSAGRKAEQVKPASPSIQQGVDDAFDPNAELERLFGPVRPECKL